jgi:AbiV family abortive infection protein
MTIGREEKSPDESFVNGSLDHSAGLTVGAEALLEKNLPHLAFHLALLALEEIGKLEVVLMGRVGSDEHQAYLEKKFLNDHVGKIFWAFWGPTFSRQVIDQKQIDWHQNLAKMLHEQRQRGLYAEPDKDFIAPIDYVSPDDARDLIDMARMRLDMHRAREPADLSEEESEHLAWFQKARYDDETREFLVSGASMRKLAELQDIRAWMKWLHETVSRRDAEMLALVEAELGRQVEHGDMGRPKWKFRIRIRTNSHLIKPKSIKAWNNMATEIKWSLVDKKKDQLLVEFSLPKAVQAHQLYDVGLLFAYRFILALNIGTQGFFWFDLPQQTERFDEAIEDIETGLLLHVARVPVRRVERTVETLDEWPVRRSGVALAFLPKDGPQLAPYRLYLGALVYWAKTDIHSGFEGHAFRAFFDTLRSAMQLYGDWDASIPFRDAAIAALAPDVKQIEDAIDEFTALADKFEEGKPLPAVNIEQAAVMKLLTDVYLFKALDREGRRRYEEDQRAANAAAAPAEEA